MKIINLFQKSEEGAVSALAGIMITAIVGAVGIAVDYTYWASERTRLQAAVDASAIAAGTDKSLTQAEADIDVAAFMAAHGYPAAPDLVFSATVTGDEVQVVATAELTRFFTGLYAGGTQAVTVNATARTTLTEPACLVTLHETAFGGLNLAGGASVRAPDCGVYVNSDNDDAVYIDGSTPRLTAPTTCLVGDISARGGQINSPADTGCAPRRDPMTGFVPPPLPTNVGDAIPGGSSDFTIGPGVYEGGLTIHGNRRRDVTLLPGTYVIKDGPLNISGGNVYGEGVTFHFIGDSTTTAELTGNGRVKLTPPTTGGFEGILMYADPTYPDLAGQNSTLTGGADLWFEGVIYFPTQNLTVDGNGSGGSAVSPYTSYIADTLTFTGNTDFEVNGDPDAVAYNLPEGFDGETIVTLIK